MHTEQASRRLTTAVVAAIVVMVILAALMAGTVSVTRLLGQADGGDEEADNHLECVADEVDAEPVDRISDRVADGFEQSSLDGDSLNDHLTARAVTGTVEPDVDTDEFALASAEDSVLRQGDRGEDVADVQRQLVAAGIDPGAIDGVFGVATDAAVRRLQQASGLVVDGLVGKETVSALDERVASVSRGEPVAIVSRGEPRTEAPPRPLAGRVIVLDPGHGGPSGARGPAGTWEDDNVLAISRYAAELLEEAGATVVLTREGRDRPYDPTKPGAGQLEARVRIANRSGADIFISVHNDWNPNPAIRGMSTYYRPADGDRTRQLARTLQLAIVAETGLRDVGLISGNFYVLRNTRMTSVLLEIGFMSNAAEEQLLKTDSFRQQAAMGIYRGVLQFYGVDKPPTVSRQRQERLPDSEPLVYGYWAQWGAEPEPMASLTRNIEQMDMVSPYWYTARGDGSLTRRESDHGRVTDLVREHSRKLIVMVNNDKTTNRMLTDDSARGRLADNIVSLVLGSGFDGVNIDFEDLQPHHRSQLTALVADVAARLRPEGRLTTVAVGAKWSTDESVNDWAAVYDYPGLARHADFLVIMAYDEHAQWRGPGPVASLPWVERIVQYAVSQVDPRQLMLGVAAYGYDWTGGRVHQILTADQAAELASRMGAEVVWNERAEAPMFRYTAGGRQHEVWFENSYSAAHKLRLARQHNLLGIALWKIGHEDQRFWDVVSSEL